MTFLDIFFFILFSVFFTFFTFLTKVFVVIATPLGGFIYKSLESWWSDFIENSKTLSKIKNFLNNGLKLWPEGAEPNTANIIAEATPLLRELGVLKSLIEGGGSKLLAKILNLGAILKTPRGGFLRDLCTKVKETYDSFLDKLSWGVFDGAVDFYLEQGLGLGPHEEWGGEVGFLASLSYRLRAALVLFSRPQYSKKLIRFSLVRLSKAAKRFALSPFYRLRGAFNHGVFF